MDLYVPESLHTPLTRGHDPAPAPLFSFGVRFVSRSEAKRLMRGLERFTHVEIDFTGVEEVGQGFVDEALRVWPSQHTETTVEPVGMTGPVEFMVRRGLPTPAEGIDEPGQGT